MTAALPLARPHASVRVSAVLSPRQREEKEQEEVEQLFELAQLTKRFAQDVLQVRCHTHVYSSVEPKCSIILDFLEPSPIRSPHPVGVLLYG
jgi:hypothetical protein